MSCRLVGFQAGLFKHLAQDRAAAPLLLPVTSDSPHPINNIPVYIWHGWAPNAFKRRLLRRYCGNTKSFLCVTVALLDRPASFSPETAAALDCFSSDSANSLFILAKDDIGRGQNFILIT